MQSIHPALPIWRWWSYSTIQYPSLPDQVAHIGKMACLRSQGMAVSWARTPAVRVTVERSAAGLPFPDILYRVYVHIDVHMSSL